MFATQATDFFFSDIFLAKECRKGKESKTITPNQGKEFPSLVCYHSSGHKAIDMNAMRIVSLYC
jgi:hypothetical protein